MTHIEQFSQALVAHKENALKGRGQLAQVPMLPDVLAEIGQLPPGQVLLGFDEQREVLTLDVRETDKIGSVLVSGGESTGKLKLMRAIAEQLNEADGVRVGALTTQGGQWNGIARMKNGLGVHIMGRETFPHTLQHLLAFTKEVYTTGKKPFHVIIIDNLHQVVEGIQRHHSGAEKMLQTLIRAGPDGKTLIIAGLNARGVGSGVAAGYVDLFRTKIAGTISDRRVVRRLMPGFEKGVAELIPGVEFRIAHPLGATDFWKPAIETI